MKVDGRQPRKATVDGKVEVSVVRDGRIDRVDAMHRDWK